MEHGDPCPRDCAQPWPMIGLRSPGQLTCVFTQPGHQTGAGPAAAWMSLRRVRPTSASHQWPLSKANGPVCYGGHILQWTAFRGKTEVLQERRASPQGGPRPQYRPAACPPLLKWTSAPDHRGQSLMVHPAPLCVYRCTHTCPHLHVHTHAHTCPHLHTRACPCTCLHPHTHAHAHTLC